MDDKRSADDRRRAVINFDGSGRFWALWLTTTNWTKAGGEAANQEETANPPECHSPGHEQKKGENGVVLAKRQMILEGIGIDAPGKTNEWRRPLALAKGRSKQVSVFSSTAANSNQIKGDITKLIDKKEKDEIGLITSRETGAGSTLVLPNCRKNIFLFLIRDWSKLLEYKSRIKVKLGRQQTARNCAGIVNKRREIVKEFVSKRWLSGAFDTTGQATLICRGQSNSSCSDHSKSGTPFGFGDHWKIRWANF
ncbi:hypothetical protein niasHT_013840 [Heterodera trifolii]|uniref:Uncharacterized protein n=1 Tax=Heterodera trifolii TaxID=157864 RepID=A0ABD2L3N0_9BILA